MSASGALEMMHRVGDEAAAAPARAAVHRRKVQAEARLHGKRGGRRAAPH